MKKITKTVLGIFFLGVLTINMVSNSTKKAIYFSLEDLIQTVFACSESSGVDCSTCGSGTSTCYIKCPGDTQSTKCSNVKGITGS